VIATQAIAFAMIIRFLGLRPVGLRCSSAQLYAGSAIASLENGSETSGSSAAAVSAFRSFAIICEPVMRQHPADYETSFSFQ
jgi:hypothetical protein